MTPPRFGDRGTVMADSTVTDPDTASELPLHNLDSRLHCRGGWHRPKRIFRNPDRRPDGRRGWGIEMVPMDDHFGPIWNLTRHLEHRCRDGKDAGTLTRLSSGDLDLLGIGSVFDLSCSCHQTKDRARADSVLRALMGLAEDDELAAMAVLVALRPALLIMARRLVTVGVEPAEAQTDVIATAYLRVLALAGEPPRHMARAIVGGTWDRLRWALESEQRCALRRCPLREIGDLSDDGQSEESGDSKLTTVLFDAVADGVLSAEAARVVHATRVQRRPFSTLACELHKGEAAVRKTRQRAERALVDAHRRPGTDSGSPGQVIP
jgi:hypothetical protein